ncbi:MAG: hypothetical protein D6718_09925 [Acidobacteria bacterium]|nr:MAG: hypothetical protein D6718_09925 [Acidobacteriota bacterium]
MSAESLTRSGATCRFVSSWGGTLHCQDPPYAEGFCRFHYECYLRGELLPNGQINEMLASQERRRTINFHGIPRDETIYEREEG